MKVIHVVPHVSAEASGPSYSVPALCRALGTAGAEVTLMTQSLSAAETPLEPSPGFKHLLYPERGWPTQLHPSPAMRDALVTASSAADVIHNHSIWLLPNVYAGRAARRTGTPLVHAPRGTLSPAALSRSRLQKAAFWHMAQRGAFHQASLYHATASKEYQELRDFGVTKPVAVLPNGIDLPDTERPARGELRTVLYLGRIHPIKGLDLLLDSWADLPPQTRAGWQLRFVGPDEDAYARALQEKAELAGLTDVTFAGAAYGAQKTAEFLQADLYVLPTKTENFGMTVAEALSAGTPVITTRGAPWAGLESEGCGWWIERSKPELMTALSDALTKPEMALSKMGQSGRARMAREYGWDHIASRMLGAYEWLCSGQPNPAPAWVTTE